MTDASSPTVRVVEDQPGRLPTILRATLQVVPGASLLPGVGHPSRTLPAVTLSRHDVSIDRRHVGAYSEVCGFGLKETLPLTYLHVVAFPLQLSIMTQADFPFPAMGTVHLENSITQHRPVSAGERLQLTVRPDNLRSHPKGRAFDMVTEVHSGGELVWEEVCTFLRRGKGDDSPAEDSTEYELVPSSGIEWPLAGNLGRRYAAVSGDPNPIHLHTLSAKAFGFPSHIAHGMWSKARCVSTLEPRLPDAVRVEVAFKKPVHLPGRVAFGSRQLQDGTEGRPRDWAFSLTDPRSGAPHLLGRTTAL